MISVKSFDDCPTFPCLGLRTHLESYGCVSVLDMASRSGNLDVFKYLLNFSSYKSLRANSGK